MRTFITTALAAFISTLLLLAGTATATPVKGDVKWAPGHYYALQASTKDDASYLTGVYAEMATTPALRGVLIRYRWPEIETAKNTYDYTSLDARVADMAANGTKFILLLQHKTFKDTYPAAPAYLDDTEYEGGSYPYHSFGDAPSVVKGHNIKLWNSNVKYRLNKLITELGARYDSNPAFVGIGLEETALGTPANGLPDLTQTQVDGYFSNLSLVHGKIMSEFPNTMAFQLANFPKDQLSDLATRLENRGAGWGGPDVRINDPKLVPPDGAYTYYPLLSGIVPLTPSIMPNNHNYIPPGETTASTPQELLDYARDTLKANFVFWTRTWALHDDILSLLQDAPQTSDPAGGLDTTCPSTYTSCVAPTP